MLRRALSLVLALVLALQGTVALAIPDCHVGGDFPVGGASAPLLSAHSADDPHADHRAMNGSHDHGAMDHAETDTPNGCADDCRCQGHCATSAASAISADSGSRIAVQLTDAPELSRAVAHPGIAPARRLRPPIEG